MKEILITNDDGFDAKGLKALVEALKDIAHLTIVAPTSEKSACGHSLTLTRPLRFVEVDDDFYKLDDGTPSDCVYLALHSLYGEQKPDLLISGINRGANLGEDITYSGTVTAAMEAAISEIPAIAVSLHTLSDHVGERDFAPAAHYARLVAEKVIEKGLPAQTLLSMNVPNISMDEIKGIQVTRQGLRVYLDELVRRVDPHGKPYYWIGGEFPSYNPMDGTDSGALDSGYVSVTPIQLDLTDYKLLEQIKNWDWKK